MIARLSFENSELVAVPAVHGHSIFAEQVNRACQDEANRPDAIAVELSHDAVAAVGSWMKELGATQGIHLPCMLGLVKPNNRIHPRHRDAAVRLQETHRLPLNEIPLEVLNEKLNYTSTSLLCLSATDSIIEAIRMGVELDVPVFGVDLGDVANAERQPSLIPDPFGERTSDFGVPDAAHSDRVIDGRREWTMAARLKRILQQHRRVLFTCGLGHWSELRRLLNDRGVKPALDSSRSEGESFTRIVVSPSIALRQMDVFPDITGLYELRRKLPPTDANRKIDYAALAEEKVRVAMEAIDGKERYLGAAFADYMANLGLLNQRRAPDLFLMLHAAHAVISPAFAELLGQKLVFEACAWATPENHSGLPHLREWPADGRKDEHRGGAQRVRLHSDKGTSASFFLSHRGDNSATCIAGALPQLSDPESDSNRGKPTRFYSWVWPPCETLLFGTAYEGAQLAAGKSRELRPEPFAGALHAGVDIKATLRAAVRGEKRIHVKVSSPSPCVWEGGGENDEPAVFLFENESSADNGYWETMLTCYASDVRRLVRDKARYDAVAEKHGEDFIASVTLSTDRTPPATLRAHVTGLKLLYGTVLFGNPCLNPRQAAQWLEASDYARCPILRRHSMGNLCDYYRHAHGIVIERSRWTSTLLQLALPYARKCVMVLHVPGYRIAPNVAREAAQRNIRLETIPLSRFPRQRIETIRNQYLVRPIDVDAMEYAPELAKAFGESATAHLNILPEHIRAQLEAHA
jgi:hypothetical protein